MIPTTAMQSRTSRSQVATTDSSRSWKDQFVEQVVDETQLKWTNNLRTVVGVGETDPVAHLKFQVGFANETMTTRGYTHLAEHLSLTSLLGESYFVNGFTGQTETGFVAAGPNERLREFLNHVISMIGEIGDPNSTVIDSDTIAHSAAVLKAEAETRQGGVALELLTELHGAAGLGLVAYPEFGLIDLDVDRFRAWTRERFTAANAVLILGGELDGVTETLDDGTLHAPASVAKLESASGFIRRRMPLGALDTVERSSAASMFAGVMGKRLMQDLREEAGVSYSPAANYSPVTGNAAVLSFGADVPAGKETEVTNRALNILFSLVDDGPAPAEMTEMVQAFVEHSGTVAARTAAAHRLGHALLHGEKVETDAQVQSRVAATTEEAVQHAAEHFMDNALFAIPKDATLETTRIRPRSPVTDQVIEGTRYPALVGGANEWMTVSPQGVTYNCSANRVSVATEDIVMGRTWADGALEVLDHRGRAVSVMTGVWENNEELSRKVAALIPASMIVNAGFRRWLKDSDPEVRPAFVADGDSELGFKAWHRNALIVLCAVGFLRLSLPLSQWPAVVAAAVVGVLLLGVMAIRDTIKDLGHHYAVYDTWRSRVQEARWQADWPREAAYGPGALHFAWLVERGHLSPWIAEAAADQIADYTANKIGPIELYKSVDGALDSTMVAPEMRAFTNWYFSRIKPSWKRPFDDWRELIGDAGRVRDDQESRQRSHDFLDNKAKRFQLIAGPLTAGHKVLPERKESQ